tara:strand:- start:29684 stop:29929 length:246 start_codon:yes stop_codon:yes gene_type:complete
MDTSCEFEIGDLVEYVGGTPVTAADMLFIDAVGEIGLVCRVSFAYGLLANPLVYVLLAGNKTIPVSPNFLKIISKGRIDNV